MGWGRTERRFGVPLWSFALTATDANRWALRLARLVTGRSKVLAFSYCYHGSVDETVVVMGPEARRSRVLAMPVLRLTRHSRRALPSSTTSRRSSEHSPTVTSRCSSPSLR